MHLFLIFLLLLLTTLSGLGLLSADTAGSAATEGRSESEVNVLLGVETDDEGGNVDDLLADSDVALADQDTGVVDGLGKAELVDTSLEAALQEILDLQGQDVIELHAGLVEDTDTDETSDQRIAFEETLGVLLVEGKKLTVHQLEITNNVVQLHWGLTGQHDGSWTESNRLARPHACCAGHTLQQASTQSPWGIRSVSFTIDLNRVKL